MASETIELPVDAEPADACRKASKRDKRILQEIVGIWLRRSVPKAPRDLMQIAADASREAQANGLTPEILEEILNGPE
jgi:hypothetical protein